KQYLQATQTSKQSFSFLYSLGFLQKCDCFYLNTNQESIVPNPSKKPSRQYNKKRMVLLIF
ncbi:MAG: hypothetical protein WCI01_12565, partial [Chlorobiaceae bacterium]